MQQGHVFAGWLGMLDLVTGWDGALAFSCNQRASTVGQLFGTQSPTKEHTLPSCCTPVRLCLDQAQLVSRQAGMQTAVLGAWNHVQGLDAADSVWHTDAMGE